MPLPAALLARLEKRGIIKDRADLVEPPKRSIDVVEEVIAENYDDTTTDKPDAENNASIYKTTLERYMENNEGNIDPKELGAHIEIKFKGYPGCPNKYNVWHECTLFCKEYWGHGHSEPDEVYLICRGKMLEDYPLPPSWTEVYDAGSGRFYYWDQENNTVSWLPPEHPRCVVADSAGSIREERYMVEISGDMKQDGLRDKEEDSDSSTSDSDTSEDETYAKKRPYNEDNESEDDTANRKYAKRMQMEKYHSKGRDKKRENDLDPMDPASYSEISRGGWTDGLLKGAEAVTGADVTAPGPLYQMRPYPNPGAVLRANAGKGKGKK